MRSNNLALLTAAFLYLALPHTAYPDINHYSNILVGDRAATMGGAFTAVADDASGTYYNPSGIAFCEGGGLSASANVLHYQSSTYQKAIRDYDWIRNSLELMPNFFGVIKTWGRHSFGASLAVPDSFTQNQDQVFNNLPASGSSPAIQRYTFNLHTQDATYLVGPSYSYRINDHMSVGVTLSYYYRSSRTQNQQTIWYSSTDYEIDNNIAELTENGLAPKIGFLAKITDKISVGAILDHTFIVSSKFTDQMTNKARTSSDLTFDNVENRSIRNTPTHIGLGFSFRPTEPLLLAIDFGIYIAPNSDAFFPNGYNNVVNVAIGGEYKITKRSAVRLGLFTNKSNMPEPTTSTSLVSHVDMYGITTGYTLTYLPTSFTIGMVYSRGSGHSQVYSDSSIALNTYSEAFTGIFSAAYNFE